MRYLLVNLRSEGTFFHFLFLVFFDEAFSLFLEFVHLIIELFIMRLLFFLIDEEGFPSRCLDKKDFKLE